MDPLAQNQPTLACDLTVFEPDDRERYRQLSRELFAACQKTRELPEGLAFQLPCDDSWILKTARWVTQERLCCPFLSFELAFEGNHNSMELRLSGPPGTKEFLRAELSALRAPNPTD